MQPWRKACSQLQTLVDQCGLNGFPMVAYWAPQSLMLAVCHDSMCLEADVSPFAAVRTYDLAALPSGSPVLVYFAFSKGEPAPGDEEIQRPVDLWVSACMSGTCVGG